MKRLTTVLLALLLLPCVALAESEVTANGVVEAENTYEITAPFSGTLLPFDHKRGEAVKAGDVLFTLDTVKVYAPADGTLTGVFATRGDSAEDVQRQYGMLACVEKRLSLSIAASTAKAYDEKDNFAIHAGETLYFERVKDTDDVGIAVVRSVSGDQYLLDVTSGDYKIGSEVILYRDSIRSKKQKVGSGFIQRAQDVTVLGAGRVLKCCVSQGREVTAGQLLFEMAADADPSVASADVTAPMDGVLELPKVISGQQVYKGQSLATLHDTNSLLVNAEVDEMDLGELREGDTLELCFDRYPGQRLTGVIRSISGIGTTKQNASYYNVRIAFTAGMDVKLGMSATVYLPASK